MKTIIERAKPYCIHIAVFFFFIVLYSLTMFPGEGGRINVGDSTKWQYLHLVNGLPHPPGYPQFLLISEVFSRIIFFLDLPERITFISVFFGALAMMVFYGLVHLLTKNKAGSLLSTLLMGVTYAFWTQATEAEVYTLNAFYLLTVFYLFIKFYLTKQNNFFLLGCAVYALSFGNHLSMITILPAIVFITLITDYRVVLKFKNILAVAAFIVIGILQYSLILYRAKTADPHFIEYISNDPDVDQFIGYVTGRDFSGLMFAFTFEEVMIDRAKVLFHLLNYNFTVFGLLLAAAGFFYYLFVRKQYIILGFISLALIGQLVFNISYDVLDLIVFFIPVYIILGLYIALIFSSNRIVIPFSAVSAATLFIFSYNLIKRDILTESFYGLNEAGPTVAFYEQQEEDLPLYMGNANYEMKSHMYFTTLTKALGEKSLIPFVDLIKTDTFFVMNGPESNVELVESHNFELVSIQNVHDFVKSNNVPHQVIFMSVLDEARQNLPHEFIQFMAGYGSSIENLPFRGSYVAALNQKNLVEQISGSELVTLTSSKNDFLEGKVNFSLTSAGMAAGNESTILVNNFDYSRKRRGINLVVYDLNLQKVTKVSSFDTHLGEDRKIYKAFRKP